MTDRHSREQRSHNMACIRKFGNESTELQMIQLFRQHHITGWRRHLPLPGRPDFTFRSARVVIFVDSCFWHRCPRCNWVPASNEDYWQAKLARNVTKDRKANRLLRKAGWRVLRIWEHSVKKQPHRVMRRILRALACQSSPDDSGSI